MKTLITAVAAGCMWIATSAAAQDFQSANCFEQSSDGWVTCEAICPQGMIALSCSYTMGNYASGDDCQSLQRISVGTQNFQGQPSRFPHDRCGFTAVCSPGAGSTLTIQGFATCVNP